MNIKETIVSDNAPKAIGPYSPALAVGDFIMISGQLGVDPLTGTLMKDIEGQTKQALENLRTLLHQAGIDMRHVLKTTVFLQNMDDFAAMNEIYAQYFSEPYPARSAVQVAALPKGALVEIEAFAIDTRALEVMEGQCAGECCCGCHD
ncbi:MAG: RidA family protein [Bulleidia sp.]